MVKQTCHRIQSMHIAPVLISPFPRFSSHQTSILVFSPYFFQITPNHICPPSFKWMQWSRPMLVWYKNILSIHLRSTPPNSFLGVFRVGFNDGLINFTFHNFLCQLFTSMSSQFHMGWTFMSILSIATRAHLELIFNILCHCHCPNLQWTELWCQAFLTYMCMELEENDNEQKVHNGSFKHVQEWTYQRELQAW